jgi:hypothetical protein
MLTKMNEELKFNLALAEKEIAELLRSKKK